MKKLIVLVIIAIFPVKTSLLAEFPAHLFEEPCEDKKVKFTQHWEQFIYDYLPYAMMAEQEYGIDATFILAQAAHESGWGKHMKGNMLFGVKDHDGRNGNEQLLTTYEFFSTPNKKMPNIISITKVSNNLYKYKVKEYFRKYDQPFDSFKDHSLFLKKRLETDYSLPAIELVDKMESINYATDRRYASKLKSIVRKIDTFLQAQNI
jgi:flagellum-specific peptidoglycan hydrolase FlgJ